MGYVRDVKNAILEALDNYDCSVEYTPRSGDRCAYFTVTIDDEWDWDWIESDIDNICDEYGLWIDDDSYGSFDLCVS
jgi:hypothetical protein